MNVLVLQHATCEPVGEYGVVLEDRRANVHRVALDLGEPLPDWGSFDAIVAMGGPMSANDDNARPWLAAEKRLIGKAVRAGVPYWGTCLGAQLLASSLGARVYVGSRPEVGTMAVRLTADAADDPVFRGLPQELLTFQWHGETFDLPAGTVLLASSVAYPHQAFRWSSNAYGVQFHLEVAPPLAATWNAIPEYRDALESALGRGSFDRVAYDLAQHADELLSTGRYLFDRWLSSAGLY